MSTELNKSSQTENAPMQSNLSLTNVEFEIIESFIESEPRLAQMCASPSRTINQMTKEELTQKIVEVSQNFVSYVDQQRSVDNAIKKIVDKIRAVAPTATTTPNTTTTTPATSDTQSTQSSSKAQKRQKVSTSLIPIKGISRRLLEKLGDNQIFDTKSLLSRCQAPRQREGIACSLDISVEYVDTWVKQADLWRVKDITTDLAYMLVQAGIRSVQDLAHIDAEKTFPILKSFQKAQPDFILGDLELLQTIVSNAETMVKNAVFDKEDFLKEINADSSLRNQIINGEKDIKDVLNEYISKRFKQENCNPYNFSEDAPHHLYKDNFDSTENNENKEQVLKTPEDLFEFDPILPLPHIVSGTVKINSNEKETSPIIPFVGAKVEIEGVVSPAEDKTEASENPSCITDATGKFMITLPERYSLKETIKIIVSNDKGKQEFIKNSTDLINATAEFSMVSIAQNILREKEIRISGESVSDSEKKLMDDSINSLVEKFKAFYGESNSKATLILSTLNELRENKQLSWKYFQQAIMRAFDFILKNATLEAKLEGLDTSIGDDGFIVSRKVFFEAPVEAARALPKVKLMGEGDEAVMLSTDTAPSRMFNYSMMQSLIAPELSIIKNNRTEIDEALDVAQFKDDLYKNPDNLPQMSTLGLGYMLNMHQAWVPDGFALGDLLYSLILAPGEEQRLIVRENTQTYELTDTAQGSDAVDESYQNSQTDDTTAAYQYGVQQMMEGGSSYEAQSSSWGIGASGSGGMAGIFSLGISGSYSKSKSSGSSEAHQNNSQNEASAAAQKFQHCIKTASNRLSQAKRISMSVATSEQSDSVATKIIANHNHSHAMTIQYWEVMRRYRIETAVDSVDLALFVPLKLVNFLGEEKDLIFREDEAKTFNRARFKRRYEAILNHAVALERALPYKYRSGLKLIQSYAACPQWVFEGSEPGQKTAELKFYGRFLSCDDLTAKIILKNGRGTIAGSVNYSREDLPQKCITREELRKEIRRFRNSTISNPVTCTFNLPGNIFPEDIASISIGYSCEPVDYTLYQNTNNLSEAQQEAWSNYQHKLWDFVKDNDSSGYDLKKMAHYMESMPEAFRNPNVYYSSYSMLAFGRPTIKNATFTIGGKSVPSGITSSTLTGDTRISVYSSEKTLRQSEFQKMEETLQHVVTETLRYSQAVWSMQSSDERIMMLAPYTIQMDYSLIVEKGNKEDAQESGDSQGKQTEGKNPKTSNIPKIPLLNCVNVRKVLGFYGNCIMLPFTFPEDLANELGRTAADVQEQIYRFHTNSFRAPTTVISLPTKGMIGEAVLNQTNVSEVIDLTRFWNWQDSPIDKMEIDSNYLNDTDYLKDKTTKDISSLGLQGVTATTPVTAGDLVSALVNKQTPSFTNITGLNQLKDLVNASTTASASGRDNIINKTSDLATAALNVQKELEIAKKKKAEEEQKKAEEEAKKKAEEEAKKKTEEEQKKTEEGNNNTSEGKNDIQNVSNSQDSDNNLTKEEQQQEQESAEQEEKQENEEAAPKNEPNPLNKDRGLAEEELAEPEEEEVDTSDYDEEIARLARSKVIAFLEGGTTRDEDFSPSVREDINKSIAEQFGEDVLAQIQGTTNEEEEAVINDNEVEAANTEAEAADVEATANNIEPVSANEETIAPEVKNTTTSNGKTKSTKKSTKQNEASNTSTEKDKKSTKQSTKKNGTSKNPAAKIVQNITEVAKQKSQVMLQEAANKNKAATSASQTNTETNDDQSVVSEFLDKAKDKATEIIKDVNKEIKDKKNRLEKKADKVIDKVTDKITKTSTKIENGADVVAKVSNTKKK